MAINQAVLFTKPLWHSNICISHQEMDCRTQAFFKEKGFYFRTTKCVNAIDLKDKNIIDQHYIVYSHAVRANSIDEINISFEGNNLFKSLYNKTWSDEILDNRILTTKDLMCLKKLNSSDISNLWNENNNPIHKIQSGLLVKYVDEINTYLINGFYPLMSENFYNNNYLMNYYVIEFESQNYSWVDFRKNILGSTNCSNAIKGSFREVMYKEFPVINPGSNNFLHGSAGPLEAIIERLKHEDNFDLSTNPIGVYLMKRNLNINQFKCWLEKQSISNLSDIFDLTEEKNSDQIINYLDSIKFH